ncbi:MAG: peptidoglycan-binding domain-containing protein [Candidatus Omnitrophica bacterium]|nr:peptidoglycan-binding domain-containing protein [Candidatus Omnitrophota bacterium]MDD5351910.1 peptidoglycan-binding domain-containing protein [Candidatus Omnitrophota bacterium]MDD5550736.1 peptidoglycan-binding domain-containing protein [Candidatus Omnitrophota bacterium]
MDRRIISFKLLVVVVVVLGFAFAITSCNKRTQESPFKTELPDYNTTIAISSTDEAAQVAEPTVLEPTEAAAGKMSTEVDASGYVAPTPQEIQTALKNAGYYKGDVDGKIGPKSKQAIMDFQKDNNLGTDGKVGPKTWSKLKAHLNVQSSQASVKE